MKCHGTIKDNSEFMEKVDDFTEEFKSKINEVVTFHLSQTKFVK